MIYVRYWIGWIICSLLGKMFGVVFYPLTYWLMDEIRRFKAWWKEQSLPIKILTFFTNYAVNYFFWLTLNDGVSEDGFSQRKKSNGDYTLLFFWNGIGRYPSWHPQSKGGWWNDFVISYKWSGWRNSFWNIYSTKWFQCKKGEKTIIKSIGVCWNERMRSEPTKPEDLRCLKLYSENQGADNEGDYLSYSESILGTNKAVWEIGGRKYFTKGKASVKYYKWLNLFWMRESRIGHTENHLDFRFKNKFRWGDERSKKEYNNYFLNKNIS